MADDLYKPLSNEFTLPTNKDLKATKRKDQDAQAVYLCGHSLGAMPKRAKDRVLEELDVWSSRIVEGHFDHPLKRDWVEYAELLTPYLAGLVGGKDAEVACMGTLTANLHLMMDSFYKPTKNKYKILCETKAFPSDQYAFASQAQAKGFDPSDAVLALSPRKGEFILRTEDILDVIEQQGDSIALVLFSGVQYYSGQLFPIAEITKKAKAKGITCGWDLAHAVGNVPLSLHDWDVDFAVWCTYKYLNGGPGSIGGLYIHDKWTNIEKPRSAGWWGHDTATRFIMGPDFDPIPGAKGFQQSNPSVMSAAPLLGSLEVFKEVGMMPKIRERSLQLTSKLEEMLKKSKYFVPVSEAETVTDRKAAFTIITPEDPEARGAQLSLTFIPAGSGLMMKVFEQLKSYGVLGDERKPDVIRLTPIALYNTLADCEQAAKYLEQSFDDLVQAGEV